MSFNPTENIDLEKVNGEQSRLRSLFNSRAKLNKREYQKARGAELEAHHRITGNQDALAEALAMQGKFQEAGKTAIRPDLKQEFIEKHVAVIQSDNDCKCDNFSFNGNTKTANQFVESYGWSEKHQAIMPFIRCLICGNLNAKELPAYLTELNKK